MRIDVSAISKSDTRIVCAAVLNDVKRFYDVPENRARFEAWKREQENDDTHKENRRTKKCQKSRS